MLGRRPKPALRPPRLLVAGWLAAGTVVAGIVVDLRWHARHGDAPSAADLLAAHWLIWIGLVLVIAVAALGAARVPSKWYTGWWLLLGGGTLYAASEAFHVWSHHTGHAHTLAHALLHTGHIAVLAGLISVTVITRRMHNTQDSAVRSRAP